MGLPGFYATRFIRRVKGARADGGGPHEFKGTNLHLFARPL